MQFHAWHVDLLRTPIKLVTNAHMQGIVSLSRAPPYFSSNLIARATELAGLDN